jgi:colicin import membrane protein
MRREYVFSVIFHVFVVGALYASGQIMPSRKIDLGEVIKVSLMSLPDLPPSEKPPADPLDIPKAVQAEEQSVKVPDTKAKPISTPEKKKEAPVKKKPPKKPNKALVEKGQETKEGLTEGNADVADVAATAGSPFAGATVDNASFEYPYWFSQAFYKINSNWQNPVDADGALVCVVYFQVLASGRVIETKVDKSSGIPAFDDACVLAIERSSPFPPFPRDFTDEILGITIPFKYQPGQ